MAEAGLKAFTLESWVGLLVPAGTPPATLTRLNKALNEALGDPATRSRLPEMGLTTEGGTAARIVQQLQSDAILYRRITADSKMRFE